MIYPILLNAQQATELRVSRLADRILDRQDPCPKNRVPFCL